MELLTDAGLKLVSAKDFRKAMGITKSDYRLLRDLILLGIDISKMSIWSPSDKPIATRHQFCQFWRNIDVIYITRNQTERHLEEE